MVVSAGSVAVVGAGIIGERAYHTLEYNLTSNIQVLALHWRFRLWYLGSRSPYSQKVTDRPFNLSNCLQTHPSSLLTFPQTWLQILQQMEPLGSLASIWWGTHLLQTRYAYCGPGTIIADQVLFAFKQTTTNLNLCFGSVHSKMSNQSVWKWQTLMMYFRWEFARCTGAMGSTHTWLDGEAVEDPRWRKTRSHFLFSSDDVTFKAGLALVSSTRLNHSPVPPPW